MKIVLIVYAHSKVIKCDIIPKLIDKNPNFDRTKDIFDYTESWSDIMTTAVRIGVVRVAPSNVKQFQKTICGFKRIYLQYTP